MNSTKKLNTICLPKTSIYIKDNLNSEIISQALYGENFKIIKENNNWHFIELQDDSYKGWIFNINKNISFDSTHMISVLNTWVYSSPNIKSKPIIKLFAGSKLKILDFYDSWAIVQIFKKNFVQGFIPKNHIIKSNENANWLKIIKKFENAPYLWGGKTVNGIDCSGLLQVGLKFKGLKIPRDTKDQLKYFKKLIFKSKSESLSNFNSFIPGDIIFWDGHVAIIINKKELIHANAFHMTVKIEKIESALKRINQKFIIKRI